MKLKVFSLVLEALYVATLSGSRGGVLGHEHHDHGNHHHHHEGGIRGLASPGQGEGQGQGHSRNCKVMDVLERLKKEDKNLEKKMEKIEEHTQKKVKEWKENRGKNGQAGNKKGDRQLQSSDVITIPVVVHVLYNTAAENISDEQILSQIEVLNKDFRRTNSDRDSVWSQAADTEFEFCLASFDPNGNPTSGITRTQTSKTSFGTNDSIKFSSQGGKDAWPAGDYMNIWVGNIGGGILGYAQFPGGSAATDGVVNDYRYFGTEGTATAPFDLGRTMTHEVGHWLNLRHIWGDGGCSVDDFVSDTPPSDAANFGCASNHVSCSSTDMVQNYMDYSNDACMNLFTKEQKVRMRALFEDGGFRTSILSSSACGTDAPTISPGPTISPAPSSSCDVFFEMDLTTDNYPGETTWTVTDDNTGETVASGGPYGSQGTTYKEEACLPADTSYTLTLNDSYGDGICCAYGSGDCVARFNGEDCSISPSFGSTTSCVTRVFPPTDSCPDDPNKTEPGDCGCGNPDTDTDFDGVADCIDNCPDDPDKTEPGECGCGNPEGCCTQDSDCNGTFCNPIACTEGVCAPLTPPNCDDGNPCTDDACDDVDGCTNTDNTAPCDDGDSCTVGDICSSGSCIGTPLDCEDGNDCTTNTCDPASGCGAVFNTAPCDDGNACTTNDACANGTCQGGDPVTCNDPNLPVCDETSGSCVAAVPTLLYDFESGIQGWIDGGGDVARVQDSGYTLGDWSIRIRDNSRSRSTLTSPEFNVVDYNTLNVGFWYKASGMETGEGFELAYSTDGGASWTTKKVWERDVDFQNDAWVNPSLDPIPVNGASNARIRFECKGSRNDDRIYIDDVTINFQV